MRRETEIEKECNTYVGERKGFEMLSAVFCFFSEIMVDPRHGDDGKADFERELLKNIDFTGATGKNNSFEEKAENFAMKYKEEQAHRLSGWEQKINGGQQLDIIKILICERP